MEGYTDEAIRITFEWFTTEQNRSRTKDMKLESGFVTTIKRYIGYGIKSVYDAPVTVTSIERLSPHHMKGTLVLREDPDVKPNRVKGKIKEGIVAGFDRLIKSKWDNEELLEFAPYHEEDGVDMGYAWIEVKDVEYIPEYYGQLTMFSSQDVQTLHRIADANPELAPSIREVLAATDRDERGDAHESPRLRCLVDVKREERDDCPEYEEHPVYKRKRYENK